MRWFLKGGVVAMCILAVSLQVSTVVSSKTAVENPKTAPAQLIVKLKGEKKSEQAAAGVVNRYAQVKKVKEEFVHIKKENGLSRLPDLDNIFSVEVDAGTPLLAVLEDLRSDADVAYAQLNYVY
jgi:hypothetical protein